MKNKQLCTLFSIVLLLIMISCAGCGAGGCSSAEIGKINLAWDPSTETHVAGYKVYYGTAPRTYGPGIDVGNVTTYSLTGLIKGKTYYIVVTAYNKSGQESRFSSEVSGVAK